MELWNLQCCKVMKFCLVVCQTMGKLIDVSTRSYLSITATDVMLEIWCGNIVACMDDWIAWPNTNMKQVEKDKRIHMDEFYN